MLEHVVGPDTRSRIHPSCSRRRLMSRLLVSINLYRAAPASVHFHFRFVSLTFLALFMASGVIVSKVRPLPSLSWTVALICSHFPPKSQM